MACCRRPSKSSRPNAFDLTPMLTHRFELEEWWPALKALARQDQSGALKVAFVPNAAPSGQAPVPSSLKRA